MAEFSIIIKKKNCDLDSDSTNDDDLSTYESSSFRKQNKEKKKSKKVKSSKKSPRKKELKKEKLPLCPICHESMDERIKRVYSRPISTGVYFPFLDEPNEVDKNTGRLSKVKICYPCYENLMTQWKEYNKIGLSHRKRKYRDRSGNRIKRENEINREEEEEMRKEIEEINPKTDNDDEEIYDEENSKEEKLKKDKQEEEEELSQDMLAQIHSHIERVEIKSNANLEKTRIEIVNTICKHTNGLQDDIQSLKIENEVVKKQVVRMRRELAEMKLEVLNDLRSVTKEIKKKEKTCNKSKDTDNEANIKKTEDD